MTALASGSIHPFIQHKCVFKTAEELDVFLCQTKSFGRADFINVQVMRSFLASEQAVQLLGGISAYIETNRSTITQDLLHTAEYAQRLPGLELTIDFSHYVVAGEMRTASDEAEELFQKLYTTESAGRRAPVWKCR